MSALAIAQALRETLLANETVIGRVQDRIHYQEIPSKSEYPHIFFTMQGRDDVDELIGGGGLIVHRFIFEILSEDTETDLLDAFESVLEAYENESIGIDLVDIEDADDDYKFRSAGDAETLNSHAYQVLVYVL